MKEGRCFLGMMIILVLAVAISTSCSSVPTNTEQRATEQQSRGGTVIVWTPEVLLEQGIEAFNNGNFDLAIEKYTEAIRMAIELGDNNYAVGYVNRGNAYIQKGEYDKSIDEYNIAIRLDPYYFLAYFNRGLVYRQLSRLHEAIKDFSQTIEIEPSFIHAYFERGRIYFDFVISNDKDDLEQIIKNWETVLLLDPNFYRAPFIKQNLEIVRSELELLGN